MTKLYPSDISYAQYNNIQNELENFKKKTKPREEKLIFFYVSIVADVLEYMG